MDPRLVIGQLGVRRRDQPAAAALGTDVSELRDRHREVRGALHATRSACLGVRCTDDGRPSRIAAGVLDEDRGKLLGRVRETGVVEVEDAQAAVSRAPEVVGPEVAMAGPQGTRRTAEVPLEGDELRNERIEFVGERGMTSAESGDELAPSGSGDGRRIPGIEADRAGETDLVQAGHQPPELDWIQVKIGVAQVRPAVESRPHAVGVGDDLGRTRPTHLRCRNPGGKRGLLERCPLEELDELVVRGVDDLLDRPSSAFGVEPPDRAEPPTRDRSVREPSPRPEVERVEQGRDVVAEARAIAARLLRDDAPYDPGSTGSSFG